MKFATRNAFWIVSALFTAIVLAGMALPVFWDMYGQVKTARSFLDNDFHSLFPLGNQHSDNGHFPLYALYLAVLFKIAGYKLWVAHLSVLPFIWGLLWQLKNICRKFLSDAHTFLVLLLCLAHPAIITQTLYFSNEIAIVFFSVWMINALLSERASHISITSMVLCLLNLRGISLVVVLLIYFGVLKKQKTAYYLLCGILSWLAWLLLHYYFTGWFIQGNEIKEFRDLNTAEGMLKNFMVCLWKICDLGSLAGWLAIFIMLLKERKTNILLNLLLLASASVLLICVPLSNPLSNRYFLICYVFLLPAFVYAIKDLSKKLFIPATLIFILVLVRSNWISYPDKYGTAWDCSLQSISYFDLRKQLDNYVAEKNINPQDMSAGFQLYFNDRYYLMATQEKEYALLPDAEMPQTLYVAQSNICNNYNAERERYLRKNYLFEKKFVKGNIYIDLYKRKD